MLAKEIGITPYRTARCSSELRCITPHIDIAYIDLALPDIAYYHTHRIMSIIWSHLISSSEVGTTEELRIDGSMEGFCEHELGPQVDNCTTWRADRRSAVEGCEARNTLGGIKGRARQTRGVPAQLH